VPPDDAKCNVPAVKNHGLQPLNTPTSQLAAPNNIFVITQATLISCKIMK